MDDFLHNLRSGKLKQQDRGRRDYQDYKGSQHRTSNDRRRTDYYAKVTSEHFSLIKECLDGLAENQRRIADAVNAGQQTEERIADALELIAANLSGSGSQPSASQPPPATEASDMLAVADVPPAKHRNKLDKDQKDYLLETISSMRSDGGSWEKIARHMDSQHVPTVSGRGKWRGSAIKKFWETHS
ncbi:MAG: hypothetical protein CR984_00845 [Proteobacteria bacterium]|nr:MAG: hypothetical protein CR984_00845 [Pseudomonadota bacterium]